MCYQVGSALGLVAERGLRAVPGAGLREWRPLRRRAQLLRVRMSAGVRGRLLRGKLLTCLLALVSRSR